MLSCPQLFSPPAPWGCSALLLFHFPLLLTDRLGALFHPPPKDRKHSAGCKLPAYNLLSWGGRGEHGGPGEPAVQKEWHQGERGGEEGTKGGSCSSPIVPLSQLPTEAITTQVSLCVNVFPETSKRNPQSLILG